MATIKTKDNNGEWGISGKAVVFEKLVGEFKVAYIEAPDKYSYDLSQYIDPHDDFIFLFRSTLNSSLTINGGELCVLYKINGEVKMKLWNTNLASLNWWNTKDNTSIDNIFKGEWNFEGTWDNDARTITFPSYGSHTYGILLYAGLGEEA